MKPAPFHYARAATVADALSILGSDPEAKLLAGGQSLLAVMNLRLARPSRLVDIGSLGELDRTFDDTDSLLVGALCTHRRLETDPLVQSRQPLLAAAARHIGHTVIRNRGTVGGSLAHADPAAELPAVMLALGATMYVEAHARPRREIAAADFVESFYSTALQPEEMLTWIRVPAAPRHSGWGFVEVARRPGDFALAGAAAQLTLAATGAVSDVRAALFGVADRPVLVTALGEAVGAPPDAAAWRELATAAAGGLEPADQPQYRRRLAVACLTRALVQATDRATTALTEGVLS